MSDVREACESVLAELRSVEGLEGVALISRDGRTVLSDWQGRGNLDTLAAMGAALMGAGETALEEFGDHGGESVLLSGGSRRLSVLSVDDEILLLSAMDSASPLERFDENFAAALSQLRDALA